MKERTIKNTRLFALLLLPALLIAALLFSTAKPTVTAQAQSLPQSHTLSQMSDEDCVDFIIENGVEIPEGFADYPGFKGFVKSIILSAEANPDYPITFNNYTTRVFAENIREIVNDYSGITYSSSTPSSTSHSSILTENEFYAWENGYENFNCYAYAIERTEYPSEFYSPFQYQPGDFDTNAGIWYLGMDVADFAQIVKADFEFLGYSVSLNTQFTNPGPNEKLLCVRSASFDYHFLKYNPNDEYWYHKPGPTSVLKHLNQQLSNNNGWVHEGVLSDGSEFRYPDLVYDGDIIYITYNNFPFTTNISGGCATVTGVEQGVTLRGSVEISSTVTIDETTYPVTAIGNSAFANRTQMSQITIPSSVTSIGAGAFSGCSGLNSMTLPFVGYNGEASNGHFGYIFGASSYSNQGIYIPLDLRSVTVTGGNISANAFYGCGRLTNVMLSGDATINGNPAFSSCIEVFLGNTLYKSASHTYNFTDIDDEYHLVICTTCEIVKQLPHEEGYLPTVPKGTAHYKICLECYYDFDLEDEHDYHFEFDGSGHIKVCTICDHHDVHSVGGHSYVHEFNLHALDPTHSSTCTVCDYVAVAHVLSRNILSDPYDSSGHLLSCSQCPGISITVSHWYYPLSISESGHSMRCIMCPHTIHGSHDSLPYVNIGGGLHEKCCEICGYVAETDPHGNIYVSYNSSSHMWNCGYCHALINGAYHTFDAYECIGDHGHYEKCSYCGYFGEFEFHELIDIGNGQQACLYCIYTTGDGAQSNAYVANEHAILPSGKSFEFNQECEE